MILRTYLRYWYLLGIAHLSSWSLATFFIPPRTLATIQAKLDLSNGVTKYFYSGVRPLWYTEAEQILKEDYQIDYVHLNYPDHTEWHETYEKAYNEVTRTAIRKRFGVDIVDLCLILAHFRYRSKEKEDWSNQIQITA